MDQSITDSKEVQKKVVVKGKISSGESFGKPIYTANAEIDVSKIRVEVLNPSRSVEDFSNSDNGIRDLCLYLRHELVKGVRLNGKKKDCNILAMEFVKQGIRPLITNQKHPSIKRLEGLPVIDEYVAGIDVGKNMIMVSVPPQFDVDHTRAFGTYTEDLKEIVNWLKQHNIKMVAMESTSVYWVPLYDLCEEHSIKPLIINPKRVKMVPGRKTDVLDAQWLMRLLACGLLQGGFIPRQEVRALRDLTRYRQELMDRAGDCINRMHKALSIMNVQLSNAISDISGKSGRDIIRAIVDGERDPNRLAALADKRCKSTFEEIAKALHGTYKEEQVFMLQEEQKIYDFNHAIIIEVEKKIEELLNKLPDHPNPSRLRDRTKKTKRPKTQYNRSPYSFDMRLLLHKKFGCDLTIIGGVDEGNASTVIFESGGNVEAFPSYKHYASWSGLAPGNKISGGKVLSGKAPKKHHRVGQACRVAAHANIRSDTGLGAQLRRHVRNGKSKKAARKATAHTINRMIYNMLKYGQEYVEKGAAAYDAIYEERKIKGCMKTLKECGYDCSKIVKVA